MRPVKVPRCLTGIVMAGCSIAAARGDTCRLPGDGVTGCNFTAPARSRQRMTSRRVLPTVLADEIRARNLIAAWSKRTTLRAWVFGSCG
jgi:hypothetical protein